MPLYEYECDACHHRFEIIQQRHSDPPIEQCPKCGGLVHKLQSAPAFQFKGTGWYITDYAKKDSSGSTAKSDDAKSEAKESSSEKGEKSEKSADAVKSTPSKESKDAPASSTTSPTPNKSASDTK